MSYAKTAPKKTCASSSAPVAFIAAPTTSTSSSSSSSSQAPVAPLVSTTASKKASKPPAKTATTKTSKAASKITPQGSISTAPVAVNSAVTHKRKVVIEIEDSDDDDEDEENDHAILNTSNLPIRLSSSHPHSAQKATRTSSSALPVYNDSEPVASLTSSSHRGPFSATSTSPFTSSHRSSGRLSAAAAVAPIHTSAASTNITAAEAGGARRKSSRLSTSPVKLHVKPPMSQLSLRVLQGPHKGTIITLPITVGYSSTSANIAKYKGQNYDSRIFGRENDFPSDDTVSSRYIKL